MLKRNWCKFISNPMIAKYLRKSYYVDDFCDKEIKFKFNLYFVMQMVTIIFARYYFEVYIKFSFILLMISMIINFVMLISSLNIMSNNIYKCIYTDGIHLNRFKILNYFLYPGIICALLLVLIFINKYHYIDQIFDKFLILYFSVYILTAYIESEYFLSFVNFFDSYYVSGKYKIKYKLIKHANIICNLNGIGCEYYLVELLDENNDKLGIDKFMKSEYEVLINYISEEKNEMSIL